MQNSVTVSHTVRVPAVNGLKEIFGTLVLRPLRRWRVAEH